MDSTSTRGSPAAGPFGLPGKHIKVCIPSPAYSTESQQRRDNNHKTNALGITVNTNVPPRSTGQPEQVFPVPTGFQDALQRRLRTKDVFRSNSNGTTDDQIGNSQPLENRLSDNTLSPGDGDIPIGISLASTVKSLPLQPNNKGVKPKITNLDALQQPNQPKTPVIIVTPTDGPPRPALPSLNDPDQSIPARLPRATSSVYSPPHHMTTPSPRKPAVVAAPHLAMMSAVQGAHNDAAVWPSIKEDSPNDARRSIISQGDQISATEQSQASRRISIETILPTPRRSRGWWNLMMSPISAISSFTPKSPAFSKTREDGPTESSRSLDDAGEEDVPSASLLENAAPIFGSEEVPTRGLAAEYYDPNISFDTPENDKPVTFESSDPILPDTETQHEDLITSSRDLEETQAKVPYEPPFSPLHGNAISNEHHNTAKTANALVPPPKDYSASKSSRLEPVPITNLSPMIPAYNASNFHEEITTPTSPSPILGKTPVVQTHAERALMEQKREEAYFDLEKPVVPPKEENYNSQASTASSTPTRPCYVVKSNLPAERVQDRRYIRRNSLVKRPTTKGERILTWSIAVVLAILLVLGVALAIMITKNFSDMPVQSQWLNLTGFPPIPTGISTVAQPNIVTEVSGCVQPLYMWSCALPKGEHYAGSHNGITPIFTLEVRFDNGSVSDTSLTQRVSKRSYGSISNTARAAQIAKGAIIKARDTFSELVYTPVPAPPSLDDQKFMGNNTDDIVKPFNGHPTPFFVSILPFSTPSASGSSLMRRHDGPIPPPHLDVESTTAVTNLYPYPEAQPLRLYNRGLESEHYGFYTYFDKSIFLKAPTASNSTKGVLSLLDSTSEPENNDGGAPMSKANTQCTFSQTRFLVQIWTRKSVDLLPARGVNSTTYSTLANGTLISNHGSQSSAEDYSRPGSFPLPVTITLDRHGGNPSKKGVYCYGMDNDGHVILDEKAIQHENLAFGGTIVNEAAPFSDSGTAPKSDDYLGVDGGDGGCKCQWQNWQ